MKKKFFAKTVLLTLGVVFILAISVFGITSLLAPVAMMDLTSSMGLTGISGDYAYQEYERSGDLACLARSFLVSVDLGNDGTASFRFDRLYREEGFSDFCTEQDKSVEAHAGLEGYTYRGYLCGLAARVKYRLAVDEAAKAEVLAFAMKETGPSFPQGNPAIQLTTEAARADDAVFCAAIKAGLEAGEFEHTADYRNMIEILEGVIQ